MKSYTKRDRSNSSDDHWKNFHERIRKIIYCDVTSELFKENP